MRWPSSSSRTQFQGAFFSKLSVQQPKHPPIQTHQTVFPSHAISQQDWHHHVSSHGISNVLFRSKGKSGRLDLVGFDFQYTKGLQQACARVLSSHPMDELYHETKRESMLLHSKVLSMGGLNYSLKRWKKKRITSAVIMISQTPCPNNDSSLSSSSQASSDDSKSTSIAPLSRPKPWWKVGPWRLALSFALRRLARWLS